MTGKSSQTCIIIGASHAGVNFAFALRKEGWQGSILLFDKEATLPYHKPPLSKSYLNAEDHQKIDALYPLESYTTDDITLKLGISIASANAKDQTVTCQDGKEYHYDFLVLATGARPIIPNIKGIDTVKNIFPMRSIVDAVAIKTALKKSISKKVAIIGGGYIGLETAASLKKLGANVTVLEREPRVLARVTAPEMSHFFEKLHHDNAVAIHCNKNVTQLAHHNKTNIISCNDGSIYQADIIVVGVGILVNTELAEQLGLELANGIKVDSTCKTSNKAIYAIGDCTNHYSPHYNKNIRLESVQNAVDQAKVAAASICGHEKHYNTIPWFWSDQYDVKLQIVGLTTGYNQLVKRVETAKEKSVSFWYFKDDELLAVDAVNNAKAYILGGRFIQSKQQLNKEKIKDSSIAITPTSFL
ncbi:NAD(P)/FAD-dependent oxidoreductase [Cellulophaga sp. E6(2014)]|uniref:NAD(P)/FAD-dependent oxidoreductase n=1 Tax=Cellulophaga sp. E6(2014) TaxID=1495334 RepID=UPI00051DCC3A|nr:FAD/NAD(P)-binding oxidoreductase [Cellulophaga sp. E6(2014)]KGK29037.1 pyridine nucleotide-disulfide oxidoreductase [Cellulophaga sp. E6(2014)]